MPWVHEELRHDHLMDDFWNVVLRRYTDDGGNYWWANYSEDLEKIDAFKVSFEPGLFTANCDGDYIPNHKFPNAKEGGYIAISRHMIMKRWDGELLGLAQSTGAIKINPTIYSTDPEEFLKELSNLYYDTVDYTTLYAYMLDKYTNHTHFEDGEGNAKPITFIAEAQFNGVLASSLDIEFHTEDYYGKDMLQSPIMTLDLVYGSAYSVGSIGKLNFKTDTNWWNDSKILIQGNIDTNSFCFILRADNAPIWHDGKVPQTPFYFGDILVPKPKSEQTEGDTSTKEFMPVAMFGGKAVHPNFDFDNTEVITNEAIMPTTRNYVHYPSNGVDSVMLKRTKFGSRYQAHYLSWEVPSNEIPPSRERYEVHKDAVEYVRKNKFFEDMLAEPIGTETTTFKFQPYGIAEPTQVLTWQDATHILVDGLEVMELVSYDARNWTMEVKRIVEKPLIHNQGAVIWGINRKIAEMFNSKRVRSWNNLTNDPNYYKYTPHPSRYSNKIHTSRLYVVHPEEGMVGELPNAVVATSINLYDGTRLTFTKPCDDGDCEEYEAPERPESKGALVWEPKPNSAFAEDDEYTPPSTGGNNSGGDSGGSEGGDSGGDSGGSEEEPKYTSGVVRLDCGYRTGDGEDPSLAVYEVRDAKGQTIELDLYGSGSYQLRVYDGHPTDGGDVPYLGGFEFVEGTESSYNESVFVEYDGDLGLYLLLTDADGNQIAPGSTSGARINIFCYSSLDEAQQETGLPSLKNLSAEIPDLTDR